MDELRADDPRQVGRYTLLARLGSGGMGDVYLGRSLGGRHVAVKVIRADLARDQGFRLRFAQEVAAARRVGDAFTAPVIDADLNAPLPWLVTGYVSGPSLAEAVQRHGPLPLSSVLTLAAGMAEGLAAVHAAGVIHHDLKPANVLLAQDGPRLIDFGLAQAADLAQPASAGLALGTPGFMSPEQVLGEPLGPASDIFSLGAILAYAVTGEPPYGTGSPDARNQRVLHLAPRLDDVPGELRPLVERCLARKPADRPTAAQLLAGLVAAHPGAADQGDWLPAAILAETRPPGSQFPSQGREAPLQPGWAGPGREVSPWEAETLLPPGETAAPGIWSRGSQAGAELFPPARGAIGPAGVPAGVPPRKRRRRAWVVGVAAALAVIGTVTGVLAASSAPSAPPASGPVGADPPGPPTDLQAVTQTVSSIAISWQGSVSGPEARSFEVLKNGSEVTSVPGDTLTYEVTGLSPGTAYRFSVIAIAGTSRSAPSSPLTVSTYASSTQQVAEAPLNWNGFISTRETASSDSYFEHAGAAWEDIWTLASNCLTKPCATVLDGSVDDWSFTGNLSRDGAVYSGSTTVDGDWGCGGVVTGTLHITLTGKTAGITYPDTQLAISSFTGTMTLDVPARPGCAASAYQMQLHSE